MNFSGYVTRVTLAAALLIGVATSARAETPYESLPLPYGDLMTQVDDEYVNAQQPARDEPAVIEGQVAAASESGELLIRTGDGMIALLVPSEEIRGVSIGETVRVSLDQTR